MGRSEEVGVGVGRKGGSSEETKEGRNYGICKKPPTFLFFHDVVLEISIIKSTLLLSS